MKDRSRPTGAPCRTAHTHVEGGRIPREGIDLASKRAHTTPMDARSADYAWIRDSTAFEGLASRFIRCSPPLLPREQVNSARTAKAEPKIKRNSTKNVPPL